MNRILLQLIKRYGPKVLKFLRKKAKPIQKLSKPLSSKFKTRLAKEGISRYKYSKMHPFDKMVIKNKIHDKYYWADTKAKLLKKDPTYFQRPANVSQSEHKANLEKFIHMAKNKKYKGSIGQS